MTLTIDVYTDLVCPWCLIRLHCLRNVLENDFVADGLVVELHPVLLMPDCPPEGVNIAEMLMKRGIDPKAVQIPPQDEGRTLGLSLDLSKQSRFYPTLAAHSLVRLAKSRGSQLDLAIAIGTAYFMGPANIGDSGVLADLAVNHGFLRSDAESAASSPTELMVTREVAEAIANRGIRSVPHFIINGSKADVGRTQDSMVAVIRQAMREQANMAA